MKFENLNSSLFQLDNEVMKRIKGGSEDWVGTETAAGSVVINGETKCYSSDWEWRDSNGNLKGTNYCIEQCAPQ